MVFISSCRTNRIFSIFSLVIPCLIILLPLAAFSQEELSTTPNIDDALEEELRYLKAETYVITASRIPENIRKTASSVTVITDKEIRQMGAKNLSDVLQTVPGMNYLYHYFGAHINYARGLPIPAGQRTLVMVNSHPLNENYTGGVMWTHDTMMLDNVKRIEIIRGPGSSLYGANAFAAVVNIITNDAEDIDGCELITRGGSYDTQQYNLLYGKTFKDLEVVFNYNFFKTHGFDGQINEDLQTSLDRIFLTHASLTPERMKNADEKYDGFLNLKYKGFSLEGKYVDRDHDTPVGFAPVLTNKNNHDRKDYYLNLSYEKTLREDITFVGKVYRNHFDYEQHFQNYPPGAVQLTPIGPVKMLNGVMSNLSAQNNRTGFEMQTTWRSSGSNTVVGGITYEEMKQFDVSNSANYLSTRSPFVIIPLARVRDLTNIQPANRSVKRNFKAFFIEDIWDIKDNLRLTAGARYDDYSDFGDSFNPRVGVTWEFARGYDLKLLYGSAFRAPSFKELYDSQWGNPDLEPEEVDTYQVSLGAEFTPALNSRVTWFRNWVKDPINMKMKPGPELYRYQNYSKMRLDGLETEMRYDLGRGSYLAANYTYYIFLKRWEQWGVPRHTGNVMANIRLSRYLNLYTSCHIDDGFRRQRGDDRDNASGFAIVNATLIAQKFLKGYEGFECRASVYNLLDKDYTHPTSDGELPGDTPMPGRNFMVEAKYKF